MTKKVAEAYVARGLDDPEVRASLEADPELAALVERAESLNLKDMPALRMPDDLVLRIQHAARARRRARRWWSGATAHGYDMALVAATLLLCLLPPVAGVWLLAQQRVEMSVLELPTPSTVRLLAPVALHAAGASNGGRLLQVTDAPTARLVVDGGVGKKLDTLAKTLAEGRAPVAGEVHLEALVNAVPFAAAAELTGEVGPTPWNTQTRLLRVQVTARAPMSAAQLEVAFHLDRVSSYRLLSAAAGAESAPSGKLEAGESFVALFEVVPKVAIGDAAGELATVRLRAGGEQRVELALRETPGRFERMPAAYRFAAAAALFGLGLQGEGDHDRALDRALVLASGAVGREGREFLALIASAKMAGNLTGRRGAGE